MASSPSVASPPLASASQPSASQYLSTHVPHTHTRVYVEVWRTYIKDLGVCLFVCLCVCVCVCVSVRVFAWSTYSRDTSLARPAALVDAPAKFTGRAR